MFMSRATAFVPSYPLDVSTMLVEEANYEGAHFQHIVDRNVILRAERIEANQKAMRAKNRRNGSRSR